MQRSTIAIGLLALTILAGFALLLPRSKTPASSVMSEGGAAPLVGDERPLRPAGPEEGLVPPSFDIVRIEPSGTGAASGRATASARILLKSDGTTIEKTDADARGEWALLISAALPPGDHRLMLVAALPDGRGVASTESVVVSIPERPVARPLVVLMQPGQASEVMQSPGGPSAQSLSLDAVDLDGEGALRIGGRAEPGIALNLYLDNVFVGQIPADDEGRWSLQASKKPAEGRHRIRVDALGKDEFGTSRVAARIDVPFERKTMKSESQSLKVETEAESWRIEGPLPTVIYGPGAARTLNPTVAYPGQVTAPQEPAAATR